jgi:hypothetical protein
MAALLYETAVFKDETIIFIDVFLTILYFMHVYFVFV